MENNILPQLSPFHICNRQDKYTGKTKQYQVFTIQISIDTLDQPRVYNIWADIILLPLTNQLFF
ncbi:hypothetical protein EM308_11255 [Flavobacterium gilvum]|uniref:Uncharacterized protein n=1 Tax=Flavobacterium gilvum TaxID=1492737 RepID=A0AAC9I4N9_9FLAO|nr:hypothetical protein EM308_11255 [Flavobacterium gilvum]